MTETAPSGPRPSPRRSSPIFAIVVVILVAALAVEAFLYFGPHASRAPKEARDAIAAGAAEPITTFGDPSAPIQIKFYAPLTLPWHVRTAGLLREYDEQEPGRIHVFLMPMGNPEADEEMRGKEFTCAAILINEENEFTLPDGTAVILEKRPTDDSYTTGSYRSEDVLTILDQMAAPAG
jgi:hypothetical protein